MAKRTERKMSRSAPSGAPFDAAIATTGDELRRRFGRNVRAARRAAGLTQEQVSARTGITRKTLSDIELGKANCTLNQVHRIAQAVDQIADHLLRPALNEPSRE